MTTRVACRCDEIGGKLYLRAQLTLPCSGTRHKVHLLLASLMVFLYPIGELAPRASFLGRFIAYLILLIVGHASHRRCAIANVLFDVSKSSSHKSPDEGRQSAGRGTGRIYQPHALE